MDLLLLLHNDGTPCLVPTNKCSIKRNAEGRIVKASVTNNTQSIGGGPNPQSPYSRFHTLFLSRFMKYCIMTSVSLPLDMLCLFGYSGLLNKHTCLFLKIPKDSIHDLSENGGVLTRDFLVGCGVQAEQHSESEYREYAIGMFNSIKSRITMNFSTPGNRNHIVSFYDSSGELFHTEYVTSKFSNTIVHPLTNTMIYVKTMN